MSCGIDSRVCKGMHQDSRLAPGVKAFTRTQGLHQESRLAPRIPMPTDELTNFNSPDEKLHSS